MGISKPDTDNINPKEFTVKLFIDGELREILVEDSFPCIKKYNSNKYNLIGVRPHDDELFMIILEKAWALINGGYDQIEGGTIFNIFELFLNSSCFHVYFSDIKEENREFLKIFKKITRNQKNYGSLTLCGSYYFKIEDELRNKIENKIIKPENLLKMIY